MGEYQQLLAHPYWNDLRYLGIGLGALALLAALLSFGYYQVSKSLRVAKDSIGVEIVQGKPDLSSLVDCGK